VEAGSCYSEKDVSFKQLVLCQDYTDFRKRMLQINFNTFPLLSTEKLVLRQTISNDESELFALRSDKRVMKYIDRPLAESIADATEMIQKINEDLNNNAGITWAITLKSDLKLIGTIGYWRIFKEHYRAEIGYLLHPDHQGKGIMQEALTAVLDYGFTVMKLHSVEANINPDNAASMKLLERNKFIKEAYFKENFYYNGKFLDSVIYSLLTPVIQNQT
jgi:[ribosomal protein S5]-alanine N-acetyltransferase